MCWPRFRNATLAAIGLGLTTLCMAQSPSTPLPLAEYQKQEWHVEDGLPESNVRMIVQRQDGNLLLATFSGVSIFDGQGFQHLKMPNAATSNIDAVNAVLPGKNGDHWIGTDGAGVLHQTATESINISTAAGHQNERIRTMTLDRADTLWIATQNGIERYRNGHMETVPNVGIIGGDITTVFADDLHGGMYFVTSSGLFHWSNGVAQHVTVSNTLGDPVALYRDPQRKLWIGTMHGLLEVTAEPNNHEVTTVSRATIPTQVTILVSDREHNLWIGTKGSGLWRWNADGASSWSTKDGLADDTVRTLYVDDENNLWIGGLSGGLARWRNAPFAPLLDPGFKPGYSSAVFGDSHSDLWLGTWGQGLFRKHNGVISHVDLPGMRLSTGIRAITEDIHHRVWIGTWFDGLYSFDGTRWTHHTVGLESLVNAVSVLHADPNGGLWVGTYTGLLYFADGIPEPQKGVSILPSKLVTDLLEDSDHSILVATSAGLYRVRGATATAIAGIDHPYVLSLAQDSQGTVWAGTRVGGLERIVGNQAYPLPADSGIPNLPIYNMVEGKQHHLLMGTSRGIIRVLTSELNDVAIVFWIGI